MMLPATPPITTSQIMQRLRAQYSKDAYALIPEVGNATGMNTTRHADALVMGLWPSRGMLVEGFEVKASRQDWQRELAKPAKADPIFKFCDRWWLVVGDPNIVRLGELPKPWGLMVPHKEGLKVAIAAPELQPEPLSRNFIAAILRGVQKHVLPEAALEKAVKEAEQRGYNEGREAEEKNSNAGYALKRLNETVRNFEAASGIRLNEGWHGPTKIGEAVKFILQHGEDRPLKLAEDMMRQYQRLADMLAKEIEAMQKVSAVPAGAAN